MALSNTFQAFIITAIFILPLSLYLVINQWSKRPKIPLPPPTTITNLFLHPIKSCHGIAVTSARLLPTGLDLDRQWMWVSYPDRKFLTIRQNARMTLIRPSYDPSSNTLTITAPAPDSMDEKLSFSIPAHPSAAWLAEHTTIQDATVWSTTMPTHEYDPAITHSFNAFFAQEVRLVYKPPVSSTPRALVGNGSPAHLGRAASTCFADLMPILVGSEASIAELNARLAAQDEATIGVTRFRPNILVAGTAPWAEDRWKTLRIVPEADAAATFYANVLHELGLEGVVLDVVARCARCHVPNVDPETAEEHKRQPWNTLMKYRRVDPGITFKPCFGMLCVPRKGAAEVRVGMRVQVTEMTDQHRYVTGM
ncbi:uncharacterized protein BDZ99DRAFT_461201 [Mytilinidion resinicola]|uniref:MOSC domain-containing protein n=1 Tax=Mytilinidion resinicola TaxID=574789 RepID=A0A6A6YUU0_9PEZI|nr:uncharacterized protein BDZ99DRAFT_461201 [Mytilinidion resinicola]KAF2812530.1 hypothetical protein BDZ99DRAFT_461201 [Mytilinidion resinicola]